MLWHTLLKLYMIMMSNFNREAFWYFLKACFSTIITISNRFTPINFFLILYFDQVPEKIEKHDLQSFFIFH